MTRERKITWIASFSHFFTHSFMTLFPAVLVVITSEQSISFMDIGLIAKYTRKASHGKSFGVNFSLIFGMGSIATAVGGYAADNFGVDFFYRLLAYVSFAALLTALTVLVVRPYQVRWQVVKE